MQTWTGGQVACLLGWPGNIAFILLLVQFWEGKPHRLVQFRIPLINPIFKLRPISRHAQERGDAFGMLLEARVPTSMISGQPAMKLLARPPFFAASLF